jgi:glutamate synthase (NADPH/NADH) small chain
MRADSVIPGAGTCWPSSGMHAHAFPEYDTPVRRPMRAAVIGAGDTAMDAVRCSIRLGAEEAHIVYRRSEQEKGARAEDYRRAVEEARSSTG